ncbi:MAG TPA: MarR family transcriptional regulator [Firmicutes bacterium]|nr:MarR family transcriptional regulator [Bacillota bacterium]
MNNEEDGKKKELIERIVKQFMVMAPGFKRSMMAPPDMAGLPKLTSLEHMALLVLAAPGESSMTMNRLASLMGISKQQTTKIADGLVELQFIERYTNPDNRREVLVEPSDAGREYLKKLVDYRLAQLAEKVCAYDVADLERVLGHITEINRIFGFRAEDTEK